ncbi:heme-binding protein [Mycobacterium sp. ACS1612]|uniref:SOUL family heme-binding protein n=1 Tax=Mycobacterium sp. ACS1612 TaxID=1834117 RepID=UPI001E51A052|nr:heme-binding protein [Mycobacterium sp. ACS1612]
MVGIRTVEEPDYRCEKLTKHVQIRHYGPRVAAETIVGSDEMSARNEGFRRLAGFIFGRNHGGDRIAMTAPVAAASAESGWVIRFYMPAERTLATLPMPDDDRVRLVEVPAESVAVLRFTGTATPEAVAAQTAALRHALQAYGFETVGSPVTWLYDPPWTIPWRRRNEVAIGVTPVCV